MRWRTKTHKERAEWRRWFAIFPTRVSENIDGSCQFVWLEYYEWMEDKAGYLHRRIAGSGGNYLVPLGGQF